MALRRVSNEAFARASQLTKRQCPFRYPGYSKIGQEESKTETLLTLGLAMGARNSFSRSSKMNM